MDEQAKKTALRMIPYGLYVLTAADGKGNAAAATVNWVTQTSFKPPLVVVGVKQDSGAHALIRETRCFALNVLGKGQQGMAFAFFKPAELDGHQISGEHFFTGETGAPLLESAIAWLDCRVTGWVEGGDHTVCVGEVVGAGVKQTPEGRADDLTLTLKDLGDKVFYGG